MCEPKVVLIKGAGDLATGVGARLWRSGFRVVMTELAQPLAIRRTITFAEAVYDGTTDVEGIRARRVGQPEDVAACWAEGALPVLVDEEGRSIEVLRPDVVVDARLAKRNLGTRIDEAATVIGLGPGFTAGQDVHAVVETSRGHYLGRVYWQGSALPDTGEPGEIAGQTRRRVIYAPAAGAFEAQRAIGAQVKTGEVLGTVGGVAVTAPLTGVLRGLIHEGVQVPAGAKIGDVDPRGKVDHCFTISDKALAVGGAVLEAILSRR